MPSGRPVFNVWLKDCWYQLLGYENLRHSNLLHVQDKPGHVCNQSLKEVWASVFLVESFCLLSG